MEVRCHSPPPQRRPPPPPQGAAAKSKQQMVKCPRCEKTVYENEGIRFANSLWHSGCFRCAAATCGCSLTLKTALTHQGNVYCKVHLPKVKPAVGLPKVKPAVELPKVKPAVELPKVKPAVGLPPAKVAQEAKESKRPQNANLDFRGRVVQELKTGIPPQHKCSNCSIELTLVNRFRCNKCADFELCGVCLSSGVHPLHKFSHVAAVPGRLTCAVKVTVEVLRGVEEGGLQTQRIPWLPTFNRGYCTSDCPVNQSLDHTKWAGDLNRGPIKYFCPSTWTRLSVKVEKEYLDLWEKDSRRYQTLYHGLYPASVHKILENGFRATLCQHGVAAVYLSPSIEYCSHPRYSRVIVSWGVFYQFVLEIRADFTKLGTPLKKRETLSVGTAGTIDPNFPNNDNLEFLVCPKAEDLHVKPVHGLVVTAVMVRCCAADPYLLPSSWWWTKWKDHFYLRKHYYVPSHLSQPEAEGCTDSE